MRCYFSILFAILFSTWHDKNVDYVFHGNYWFGTLSKNHYLDVNKLSYLAECFYRWLLFKCLFILSLSDISFLHQEVFSSYIFSLASITMADHQEYFFTQFLSIQMVSSFFNSCVSLWMCVFWCVCMIRFKTIRNALTLLSMDYRPSVRSRSLGIGQVHVYGRDRVKRPTSSHLD